jgi:hypothetical protein
MTDNKPFDAVTMHIPAVFDSVAFEEMQDIIEALNLGNIAYIDKNITYRPGTTERLYDSYTVYFEDWSSQGEGARVRQCLQNGEKIRIHDHASKYIWMVSCPICQKRRQKEKVKPIRYKTPTWTKTSDRQLINLNLARAKIPPLYLASRK